MFHSEKRHPSASEKDCFAAPTFARQAVRHRSTHRGAVASRCHPRRHREEPETRAPTTRQLWGVAALAALAAVLAALADAEPTGVAWLDAAYRAALGAGMVLAASRARRWSLFWCGGVLVVFAPGLMLPLATLAIAAVGALAWFDRRDRVTGAVVGLLLSVVAFRLGGVGFHGLTAFVGAVAVVPLLVSGYRNSRRRWRRIGPPGRRPGGGRRRRRRAGRTHRRGSAQRRPRLGGHRCHRRARRRSRAARATPPAPIWPKRSEFDSAARTFNGPLLQLSRAVPVVGQHVAAVGELSSAGADLADSALGRSAWSTTTPFSSPRAGSTSRRSCLPGTDHPSDRAVNDAIRTVDERRSPWLLAPCVDRIDGSSARLLDLAPDTELARVALDTLPAMLGGDGAPALPAADRHPRRSP